MDLKGHWSLSPLASHILYSNNFPRPPLHSTRSQYTPTKLVSRNKCIAGVPAYWKVHRKGA